MNCEDLQSIVNELAENRPMDATARVTGLAHVAICAECATRLQDARNVSAGLQTAATAETEETPARVRGSLLAAFAEHHAEKNNVAASPQMLTPASKRSSRRTFGWWGAAAVAAAAVVVLALMLPSLLHRPSPAPAPPTQTADKGAVPAPTSVAITKQPESSATPEPERKPAVAKNTVPKVGPASRPTKTGTVARNTRLHNRGNRDEIETVAKNNQYFPLTYLASATAMESGTVVRVQLSRSALISLGLPMSGERTSELIKADLVLGDDGVARAIRLVQ